MEATEDKERVKTACCLSALLAFSHASAPHRPLSPLIFFFFPSLQIKDWAELDKLAGLPELREVLFIGNPIYDGLDRTQAKLNVLKRLPHLAKIDNEMVIDAEREMASKL